jgi:hypothetical protein
MIKYSDPDSIRTVNSDQVFGTGSRRTTMTHKKIGKNLEISSL